MADLFIYLFRHGQTPYNRDGRFTGWHNPNLTKVGIKHAQTISRKLKNKKFQIAFYTRLARSKKTLKEVLKYHPECKKTIKDDRMIERNYGALNGTLHTTFIHNISKQLYELEGEGDAFLDLNEKDKGKIEKFLGEQEYNLIHRGYNVSPPKGESLKDVEKRVNSFIQDLKKLMKKHQVSVAISAHGNSIRMFRKIMEKTSVEKTTSWVIPYDKIFTYKIKVN